MTHKILSFNMSHARRSTLKVLEADSEFEKFKCLKTIKYGSNEFIIHINAKDFETYNRFNQDMPYDLQSMVALAVDFGFDAIILSEDEKHDFFYLPHYEYANRPDDLGNMANFEDCYCGGELLRSVELDTYGNEIVKGHCIKKVRDYYGKKA